MLTPYSIVDLVVVPVLVCFVFLLVLIHLCGWSKYTIITQHVSNTPVYGTVGYKTVLEPGMVLVDAASGDSLTLSWNSRYVRDRKFLGYETDIQSKVNERWKNWFSWMVTFVLLYNTIVKIVVVAMFYCNSVYGDTSNADIYITSISLAVTWIDVCCCCCCWCCCRDRI
jgi:hypothetical protein